MLPCATSRRVARRTLARARSTSSPPRARRRRATSSSSGWIRNRSRPSSGPGRPAPPARTRVTSRPVDSRRARTSPARGSPVRCRASVGGQGRLGGRAEQQVALVGVERPERLTGHQVGERRSRLGAAADEVRGGAAGARAGGQHHGGAPAAGPRDDRVAGLGSAVGRVLGHQRRGLPVAEPQHVAAQHRQVAEELGHQPGEAQVPAGEQQHPQGAADRSRAGRRSGAGSPGRGAGRRRPRPAAGGPPDRGRAASSSASSASGVVVRPPPHQVASCSWAARCSQPATPSVFPDPAGATTTVTAFRVDVSSRLHSPRRATYRRGSQGAPVTGDLRARPGRASATWNVVTSAPSGRPCSSRPRAGCRACPRCAPVSCPRR